MTDLYHTALSGEVSAAPPREWWADGGCFAFVHDVAGGLPPEMLEADVLYAELPWADGYDTFLARAHADGLPTYPQWLYRLNCALAACRLPWVIVAGHAASRHLGCEWFTPVTLNGSVAWAMGGGGHVPPGEVVDAEGLVRWLSGNPEYETVGDFCAGYGRTARIFVEAGKRFIASDLNPVCIGHIALEAPKWFKA